MIAECFLVNAHLNKAWEEQIWKKTTKTGYNLANYNMNQSMSVSYQFICCIPAQNESRKLVSQVLSLSLLYMFDPSRMQLEFQVPFLQIPVPIESSIYSMVKSLRKFQFNILYIVAQINVL